MVYSLPWLSMVPLRLLSNQLLHICYLEFCGEWLPISGWVVPAKMWPLTLCWFLYNNHHTLQLCTYFMGCVYYITGQYFLFAYINCNFVMNRELIRYDFLQVL